MLPIAAVDSAILELIKSLQARSYLNGFHLVGGTALALQLGHRQSIDIDLFSNFDFDIAVLLEHIHQDYSYQLFLTAPNTIKGCINGINVDIIAHRYKILNEPEWVQGARLLSLPDLVAMKLNAISVSGQRSKDFIDLYYLLNQFDLGSMLGFYRNKYDQENVAFVLKSLIYFNEVDLADWPILVKNPGLKWEEIKKKLEKVVMDYLNHY